MLDQDVVVKDVAPRTIVYLRCKGSWRQLMEMLARLREYVVRTGLKATGPVSGVYYNTPNEVGSQELEWEVFYPVATETPESIEDEDGFGIREIPGARMAITVHKGSYRKAALTYRRLEDWIQQQGLMIRGPAEEIYLSNIVSSTQEQSIEIRLPVSSA